MAESSVDTEIRPYQFEPKDASGYSEHEGSATRHSCIQDLEIPRFLSRFEDLQRFEKILRFPAAEDFTEFGIN